MPREDRDPGVLWRAPFQPATITNKGGRASPLPGPNVFVFFLTPAPPAAPPKPGVAETACRLGEGTGCQLSHLGRGAPETWLHSAPALCLVSALLPSLAEAAEVSQATAAASEPASCPSRHEFSAGSAIDGFLVCTHSPGTPTSPSSGPCGSVQLPSHCHCPTPGPGRLLLPLREISPRQPGGWSLVLGSVLSLNAAFLATLK